MGFPTRFCFAIPFFWMAVGCGKQPSSVTMQHDLGTRIVDSEDPSTQWARHTFVFYNPSKTRAASLSLRSKSCGCTNLEIEKPTVPPGGQTKIEMEYQLRPEEKVRRERVLLATGVSEMPRIGLTLSVKAVPRFAVSLASRRSIEIFPDETKRLELTATAHRKVNDPKASIKAISRDSRLILQEVVPQQEVAITDSILRSKTQLSFLVREGGAGSSKSPIAKYELRFGDSKLEKRFVISKLSHVRAIPDKLYLNPSHSKGSQTQIRLVSGIPFSVTDCHSDAPWLSFAIDGSGADTEHNIEISLIGDKNDPGVRSANVVFDVTHSRQQQVVVPIVATW